VDGLEGHEDADVELLNKVVEKVMLKKIKNLLDTMNPISSKETRYAVQAVEQISYYVEKHERSFQVNSHTDRIGDGGKDSTVMKAIDMHVQS
jgi:hypothetical protein